MSLDLLDYIDIAFDVIMISSAYAIYRIAKGINFNLSVISDKAVETNTKLIESISSSNKQTLDALSILFKNEQDIMLSQNIIMKDQANVMEKQLKVLEEQQATRDDQVKVLEKQIEVITENKDLQNNQGD